MKKNQIRCVDGRLKSRGIISIDMETKSGDHWSGGISIYYRVVKGKLYLSEVDLDGSSDYMEIEVTGAQHTLID